MSRMDARRKQLDALQEIWSPDQPLPARPVLQQLVTRLAEIWDMPKLARQVAVGYNPRLRTTLGRAFLQQMAVELNPRLLIEHPAELIPTLAHELAHLVVHVRYGRDAQPHGEEFQLLMRLAGFSDRATHDLPVGNLRRKRQRYLYLHQCSECGQQFVARSVKRKYYCKFCGPSMTWELYRVPNTTAGQALLAKMQNG